MEFERALFRIHQRALHAEGFRKTRLFAERRLPWVIFGLLVCLVYLHQHFVAQARCFPDALRRAGFWNATLSKPVVAEDVVLAISIADGPPVDVEEADPSMPVVFTQGGSGIADGVGAESRADGGPNGSLAARDEPPAENMTLLRARWPPYVTYRFALDREVLALKPSVFKGHKFRVHDVTVTVGCLARSGVLRDTVRLFDVWDNIVINELAYALNSRGYLERFDGADKVETWAWSAEQVQATLPQSLLRALVRKLVILIKSCITIMLVSAITGFFIRVAVNGSAVLLFPIALIMQHLGPGRISIGVLTRSFPWIGVHVEVLRRAGWPLGPLFRSHFYFLALQSFVYLSANLAWRLIFYRKSAPEGFEERIFSFCSILELFNLVFVRTVNSTAVFPKLAFSCMVFFHFYIFIALYPFHTLAFTICVCACLYTMAYCLNHFEEPALRADPFSYSTPTSAHPRASYMPQLSPAWTVETAPLWTMFYPPCPATAYSEEAMRHVADEEYAMP